MRRNDVAENRRPYLVPAAGYPNACALVAPPTPQRLPPDLQHQAVFAEAHAALGSNGCRRTRSAGSVAAPQSRTPGFHLAVDCGLCLRVCRGPQSPEGPRRLWSAKRAQVPALEPAKEERAGQKPLFASGHRPYKSVPPNRRAWIHQSCRPARLWPRWEKG